MEGSGRGWAELRSWLGWALKVELSDGRRVVGELECTDREPNVILSCSTEYWGPELRDLRYIGLVMIPAAHIAAVQIARNWPPPMLPLFNSLSDQTPPQAS